MAKRLPHRDRDTIVASGYFTVPESEKLYHFGHHFWRKMIKEGRVRKFGSRPDCIWIDHAKEQMAKGFPVLEDVEDDAA